MSKAIAIGPHAISTDGIARLPQYPGVYLIHFATPVVSENGRRITRHYVGWAANIRQRIQHHRDNVSGSKFMEYVAATGTSWRVVHLWLDASRTDERRIKRQHHAARFCPCCNPVLQRRKEGGQQCQV